MTKKENKQRIKNEALHKIQKIFNPQHKTSYSNYQEDGSYSEQRESMIFRIISEMELELKNLKTKKL